MSEQRGFVQGVVFILLFSALILAMPVDFQGEGSTPDDLVPVNPSLIAGFSDSENYTKDAYSFGAIYGYYDYSLNSLNWRASCLTAGDQFRLGAKDYVGGVIWLGNIFYCDFISEDGINRGSILTYAEIDADADDGAVRYSLTFEESGNSAGGFVIYWNDTTYSDSSDAWDNSELYFLHGVGIADAATLNIASLLISILFLQLPDCPTLINILIASPIWANIIYIFWFIIKETLPFV